MPRVATAYKVVLVAVVPMAVAWSALLWWCPGLILYYSSPCPAVLLQRFILFFPAREGLWILGEGAGIQHSPHARSLSHLLCRRWDALRGLQWFNRVLLDIALPAHYMHLRPGVSMHQGRKQWVELCLVRRTVFSWCSAVRVVVTSVRSTGQYE